MKISKYHSEARMDGFSNYGPLPSPPPDYRGRGKRRGMRARMMLLGAIAPIAAALAPVCGRAAVQLSGVAAGTAAISQRGSVTNIRTSNNAILNFSQFNIPIGSTVDFIQPNAASRELNRINSAAPSAINGSLISNGTVYLVNPAGVIFGPGAVINVNQIYAAGAYISNQDFLAGNNHFTGVAGMVSNSGQISANGVYLVGSQVLNQGTIVAPGGLVAMVAGSDVLLGEEDSHIVAKVIPLANASSGSAGAARGGFAVVADGGGRCLFDGDPAHGVDRGE